MHKTVSIIGYGWLGKLLADHFYENRYSIRASTTTALKLLDMHEKGYEAHLVNLENGIENENPLLESSIHIMCLPPSKIKGDYSSTVFNYIGKLKQDDKVIFISSTSVYPEQSGHYTEESPTREGKISAAEKEIERNHANHLILRCSGLFGKHRDPGNFLSGKTGLTGSDSTVNLVHGADVCEKAFALIEKDARGAFNLSLEGPYPKKILYEKACAKIGNVLPQFDKDTLSVHRHILTNKAETLTGSGFQHTRNWYNSI